MLEALEISCFHELEQEHATSLFTALLSDVSFKRRNCQYDSQLGSCYGSSTSHKFESYKSTLCLTTGHRVGSRLVKGSLQV